MCMKKLALIIVLIILAFTSKPQEISLNGKWSFAIDPTNVGEQNDWHLPLELAKDSESLDPCNGGS